MTSIERRTNEAYTETSKLAFEDRRTPAACCVHRPISKPGSAGRPTSCMPNRVQPARVGQSTSEGLDPITVAEHGPLVLGYVAKEQHASLDRRSRRQ